MSLYRAPTERSRNRRGIMDAQDRLWFAEYRGNKIGMFDTKEEKFKEWALPTPWTGPYFPTVDRNGEIWTGGMTTDRVVRLNPKTNETVEYFLPKDTNIRRVYRGQHDDAGDVLDRQQSRRLDRQGRTARLAHVPIVFIRPGKRGPRATDAETPSKLGRVLNPPYPLDSRLRGNEWMRVCESIRTQYALSLGPPRFRTPDIR